MLLAVGAGAFWLLRSCDREFRSSTVPPAFMKALMASKLVMFAALILAAAWLLRGHDLLTGVALSLLFIFVTAKIAFAIIARRCGWPPTGDDPGSSDKPVSRPPGGRPPAIS